MKPKTVLVVEDEQDIRETLCEFLVHAGYEYAAAKNGRDALELLARTPRPDAILLDMMMPIMSGKDFLSALALNPSYQEIPVLLMTAANIPADTPNVAAFIRKPFRSTQVLAALAKLLSPSAP
jgi:CheY-like chemotaxis protein